MTTAKAKRKRTMDRHSIPVIESLTVKNYRALKDVTFTDLRPLTILLGPNGSGKSTVFDVFAFLAECFSDGLRKAWDKRGRFRELRSRGASGPVEIDLKYREPGQPLITYHLAIDEENSGPIVSEEWLRWSRHGAGRPFKFLEYARGEGAAISGEEPDEKGERVRQPLASPDELAVRALGVFKEHPRVMRLRSFISRWYVSYLSIADTRGSPEAGPQEQLSRAGDNLANVIQYLSERHPDELRKIIATLARRVPRLESVDPKPLDDGRLLLTIKDAPFDRPILARWASDGTLKMLAYLTVLHSPNAPPFIGVEEPENFLHPMLLPELAEELRGAAGRSQVLVTTHSPFLIDEARPEEVWVLFRGLDGFTRARRVSDMPNIVDFIEHGAKLGNLWLENHFDAGNPLLRAGGMKPVRAPAADHKGGHPRGGKRSGRGTRAR